MKISRVHMAQISGALQNTDSVQFQGSHTTTKNSVLLAVTQEDILSLLLFDHQEWWYWAWSASVPPGDTEGSVPIPRGHLLPLAYSCTVSIWGSRTLTRTVGMNKRILFTTFIKSLPCTATFPSSPRGAPSLPHQGPHTSAIHLPLPQHDGHPGWNTIPHSCLHSSHSSPMCQAPLQSYPPEAFLSAHIGLPVPQSLGLPSGTWSCGRELFT